MIKEKYNKNYRNKDQENNKFIKLINYLKENDVNNIYELNIQEQLNPSMRKKLFNKAIVLYTKGAAINPKIFNILLEKDLNPNSKISIKNKGKEILSDNYPLHISVRKNDFELSKILLDHGANVNLMDYNKRNSLFYLLSDGDKGDLVPLCSLLLERGINVNCNDSYGDSPLMMAVNKNDDSIVNKLLQNNCSINDINHKDGNTVLHYAIYHSNMKIVSMILEYKPDMTIKNCSNETALELAKTIGNYEIIQMINDYINTTEVKLKHIEDKSIINIKDIALTQDCQSRIEIPFKFNDIKLQQSQEKYDLNKDKHIINSMINLSSEINRDKLIFDGLTFDNQIQLNKIKAQNHELIEGLNENQMLKQQLNTLKEKKEVSTKQYESLLLFQRVDLDSNSSKYISLQKAIDKQETLNQILVFKCFQLTQKICLANHNSQISNDSIKRQDYLQQKFACSPYKLSYVHRVLTRDIQDYVFKCNKEISLKKSMINNLLELIKTMTNDICAGLDIQIYGSYATQTSFKWSEINILITPNKTQGNIDFNHQTFLQSFFIKLQSQPWFYTATISEISNNQSLMRIETNTQYDNITILLKATNYINHEIRYANMIITYLKEYDALRPLLLITKALLKYSKLNSLYPGGVNAYTLTLLIIYFLQYQQEEIDKEDFNSNNEEHNNLGKLFLELMKFYSIARFDFSKAIVYIKSDKNDYMSDEIINRCLIDQENSSAFVIDPLNYDNNVAYNCFNIEKMQELFSEIYNSAFSNCECSCHYNIGSNSFTYEEIDHCILSKIVKTVKRISKQSFV